MNETDKRICKQCGVMKERTFAGKFGKTNNKKYVDENAKLWNGSTCCECHTKNVAENMRKMRLTRKILNNIETNPDDDKV